MNAPEGEETIFAEALRLAPDERAAYLAQSTSGNPELRRRVECLLGSYGAGDFLEQAAAPQLCQTRHVTVPLTEKPGDTIGRYKLLQQIGEGGCGVVYMAEQAEPVRRRVALKIIKLGMDTKSVIARFEAERQALAMMDHPNIAKVLDAGATETGRPYFVMELVRGMKITEYCDEKKLSTRERLDLVIHVCHAIQHAHQKGIIHRDIKPSNILVTVNDGAPVPKVIDFGIAKATSGQQLTDKTLFTAFEQFIGTPAYMSPEQAVLTSLDIDTRSDIYALGVLLYEMLTGRTPFDAQELLAIGLDEMRRTIREQEPPRPSTRLSTLPGQELSTTAQRRGLDAPKLVSELRGDLDWIVMKALEKDRARRYETANGMAADIQRHLNHEPVVACPPGRWYRLQKLVRRNKLAFTAGSAVAASMVIGLTLSTILFFRERAARERADEQTAIAEAVNDFLQEDLLRQAASLAQAEAQFTPDPNLTVREALDRAAERIGDRFKNQPLQEAAVRHAIGNALIGVGEYERAIVHLQRAWDTRQAMLGPDHPDTLKSMLKVAFAYGADGKPDRALPLMERGVKLSKAALGPDHPGTLNAMQHMAEVYCGVGRREEAVLLQEETLKRKKAKLGPDHRDTLISMDDLAWAYCKAGKLDQALPLAEKTLQRSKATLGPDDPITMHSMDTLANCYIDAGKLDQATSLYEDNLKLQQARLGPDDPSTLCSMHNLTLAYHRAGKKDQALELAGETLKLRKAKRGPDHSDTLRSMAVLADAYHSAGKLDQAVPLYEETLKLMKAKLGPDHLDTLGSMANLALTYRAAGKLDQALPLLEETLKLMKARVGPEDTGTLKTMNNLAVVYVDAGKLDQALPLYEETLKLQQARLGPEHKETLDTMNNLAVAYCKAGKLDQGLPLLEEVLTLKKASHGPDHPNTMKDLAWAYETARKLDQAIPIREELLELRKAKLGPDHPDTLGAMNALGLAYRAAGKLNEALPLLAETLELRKARLGPEDPNTLASMNNLAETYRKAGKLDQLEAMYREELAQQSGDSLSAKIGLGRLLLEAGKTNSAGSRRREELASEGEDLVRGYLTDVRSRYTNDPLNLADRLADIAEFHYRLGNYAEAAPLYREVVQCRRAGHGGEHEDVLAATASLARLLGDWAWAERDSNSEVRNPKSETEKAERAREAEKLLRDVLAVRLRDSANSWRTGDVKSRLGGALVSAAVTDSTMDAECCRDKLSEAEALLVEGCERVQSGATDDKYKRDALQRIVRLYEAWNKLDKRSEWQQKLELFEKAREKSSASESLIQDTPAINAETR